MALTWLPPGPDSSFTFYVIEIMLETHPLIIHIPSCVLCLLSLLLFPHHFAFCSLLPFTSHCFSLPIASFPWSSHPFCKSSYHLCPDIFLMCTLSFSYTSKLEFDLLIKHLYLVFPGNSKANVFRTKLV